MKHLNVIVDKGLDLLSVTFLISFLVSVVLYTSGLKSKDQGSSLKRHVSGNIIHDWGVSRHCNYLGELMLALSFSLPCGASSIIPYFYPLYLLILLIWRERRDEERCAQKYKEVWMEYCKLVPWRILP
ncbi:delta(14)-sterol reductase-like isoform X2 [Aristolochia californica]|uniref:delta(14)-sterol reductase-like isoform X2 n=1 Tax=Aristolochia californica TaxID=171875 RepID=UPI0035DB813E